MMATDLDSAIFYFYGFFVSLGDMCKCGQPSVDNESPQQSQKKRCPQGTPPWESNISLWTNYKCGTIPGDVNLHLVICLTPVFRILRYSAPKTSKNLRRNERWQIWITLSNLWLSKVSGWVQGLTILTARRWGGFGVWCWWHINGDAVCQVWFFCRY